MGVGFTLDSACSVWALVFVSVGDSWWSLVLGALVYWGQGGRWVTVRWDSLVVTSIFFLDGGGWFKTSTLVFFVLFFYYHHHHHHYYYYYYWLVWVVCIDFGWVLPELPGVDGFCPDFASAFWLARALWDWNHRWYLKII